MKDAPVQIRLAVQEVGLYNTIGPEQEEHPVPDSG
jgi:hypothetical protein